MAPHEPVLAVHLEIQAPPKDGPGAVELLARFDAALLDLLGAHAARNKWNHAIPVLGMEPPAIVEKPSLLLKACVERCSRERRQVVERDDVETVALSEGERFVERVAVIFVVAEDECGIEPDFVAAQVFERLLI